METHDARDEVHAALIANAAKRAAIRPAILAGIRAGRDDEMARAEMGAVLADDERLQAIHRRLCRNIGCGVG